MKKFFDAIYAFDFDNNRWEYDCKYYLKDGWWYWLYTDKHDKPAFPCDKYHIRELREIASKNFELFNSIDAYSNFPVIEAEVVNADNN